MSAAQVRECPDCGELSSSTRFWRNSCEAAWWSAQVPSGTVVIAASAGSCPFGLSVHSAAFVVRTGDVRGASCRQHLAANVREHLRVV